MLQQVLLPLLGMGGFALVAIATPGSEHNHYSQMMNLKDKDGQPLMMTIRTSLVCPACIDLGLNDACEHRLDLLPPWKSTVGMSKVRQILDGDVYLNQRENLGVITDGAHYFIKPAWVNDLRDPEHGVVVSANPRLVFIGIDPSGGGSASSWACTAVYFQHGDCVVSNLSRAHACVCVCIHVSSPSSECTSSRVVAPTPSQQPTSALKRQRYSWRNAADSSV